MRIEFIVFLPIEPRLVTSMASASGYPRAPTRLPDVTVGRNPWKNPWPIAEEF
jgi:hypothetical protein